MKRFTLSYATADGERLRLFNLSQVRAGELIAEFTPLGCADFKLFEQGREYSDTEIVFLTKHPRPETL